MARSAIAIACLIASLAPARANVVLVADGKPAAEIVVVEEATPTEVLAAKELQQHVELMTGAALPIVPKPTGATAVYVGRAAAAVGLAADELELESLAFPPMGTGFYGVPLDVCARVMLGEIEGYLRGETHLKEVVMVALDSREYFPLKQRFDEISG